MVLLALTLQLLINYSMPQVEWESSIISMSFYLVLLEKNEVKFPI